MLKIQQFRYATDNMGYLVYGPREAMAVDGGAVKEILSFIEKHHLTLACITNTHEHGDHTPGNDALARATGAVRLTPQMCVDQGAITLDGDEVGVLSTPGHSMDSVVFRAGNALVTGDTLFNGTVGNCFSGDMKAFFQSIKSILAFPGETIIYAGHDYVVESMAVAVRLEPENPDIPAYLDRYTPAHVRSTLAEELKVNPYIRFNAPGMIAVLKSRGLPVTTEYERWQSVMFIE